MWDYTDKVKDYYRNPKNVGEIENPDAVGEVGSLVCGDALKLYLKIDENQVITDAKFQTFGCGSAVASSSILTEMVKGKTLEEAQKITNDDICNELGGLPDQKIHCSVMGKEALDAAIANYKGIKYEDEDHGKIVCKCYGVTEEKLRTNIKQHNLDSLEGIVNHCKAGGGCGMCHSEIEKILADEISKRTAVVSDKPMSKTQLILKINNVLENIVAPELRKDGGDIELVDIDEYKVYVKLQGACKGCRGSNNTLKNFVEKTLKEQVSSEIEIIES